MAIRYSYSESHLRKRRQTTMLPPVSTKLSDAVAAIVPCYLQWYAQRDSPNMSLLEAFLPEKEG